MGVRVGSEEPTGEPKAGWWGLRLAPGSRSSCGKVPTFRERGHRPPPLLLGHWGSETADMPQQDWGGQFQHVIKRHTAIKLHNQRLYNKEKPSCSTPAMQSCENTCARVITCTCPSHTCKHTHAHTCPCPQAWPWAGPGSLASLPRLGQEVPNLRPWGPALPSGLAATQGSWRRS